MASRRMWIVLVLAALLVPAPLAAEDAAPDLEALAKRLARPTDPPSGLWLALWEVGEAGTAAAALVPAVAAHLASEHELTRRLAAETLGKIGADSPAAVAPMLEALPRATGAFEEALLRALVALEAGVPFRGTLPETITYASTPCLQELERAYEQKLVKAADLPRLEACRKEARAHAQRIETDHAFRLGEQTAAGVAARLGSENGVRFAWRWSAPFLIVGLARDQEARVPPSRRAPTMEAGLTSAAAVCQAVYRHALAEHGSGLGLRPLEEAFGGRADLAPGKRSFEDGFPVQVWLVEDRLLLRNPPDRLHERSPGVQGWFDRGHDRGVLAVPPWETGALPDPELLGHVAARALLEAWGRQQRDWREAKAWTESSWLPRAIATLWGSSSRDAEGRIAIVAEPRVLKTWVEQVEQVSIHRVQGQGSVPPWMPLERLLRVGRMTDTAEWASEIGLNPQFGDLFARAQGVAFALFLRDHPSAMRRADWLELQRLALLGPGNAADVRRVLRLRDEDEVEALDAELRAWWHVRRSAVAPPLPPGAPAVPGQAGAPR